MRAVSVAIGVFLLVTGWASTRTAANGHLGSPVWSRDGKRIAWTEGVGAESRIWVAAATMKGAHPVSPPIDALGQVAWLPGDRILYWANSRLFVLELAGRSSLLANVGGEGFSLDRRGAKVATGDAPCSLGCYGPVLIYDLNGAAIQRVGGPRVQNMSPTFSPSASRVAFERILCDETGRCEHPAGVWIAAITSGKLRRVTTGNNGCPSWSPNGRAIAYVDLGNVADEPLRLVPARGGTSRLLVPGVGCNLSFPPQWSPDSRSVAFVSRTTGQLVVVNVRTRRSRALTGVRIGTVFGFAWSPDSSKLLLTGGPVSCSSLWLVGVKTRAAHKLRGC